MQVAETTQRPFPGGDDPKDHPDEAEPGSNHDKPFEGCPVLKNPKPSLERVQTGSQLPSVWRMRKVKATGIRELSPTLEYNSV